MRCYYDPPVGTALGMQPNRIQGMPPQLIVAGISPEVHPDRFCRHHPLIVEGQTPEVVGEPKSNGIILAPVSGVQ